MVLYGFKELLCKSAQTESGKKEKPGFRLFQKILKLLDEAREISLLFFAGMEPNGLPPLDLPDL
jgi:hypothetical protein